MINILVQISAKLGKPKNEHKSIYEYTKDQIKIFRQA